MEVIILLILATPIDIKRMEDFKMNYVIKNRRLRDYLYTLGFNYKEVSDKTGKQNYVYLFPIDENLEKAITYYTQFKNNKKNNK